MMHVKCNACGNETAVDERAAVGPLACTSCGAPLALPALHAPAPPKKSNTMLIVLIVGGVVAVGLCGVIIIVAAIAIPGLLRARIAANERNAAASLKTVVTAQEMFRHNDMDRNDVADYWTANVAGLYCLQDSNNLNAIAALNDIGVASADIDAMNAAAVGFENADVQYEPALLLNAGAGLPKAGYAFQALINGPDGAPLAAATDPSGAKVHNLGAYGFMAVPVIWDSTGNFCFIVNEGASVFRCDFGAGTSRVMFGNPLTTFDGSTPCDVPSPVTLSSRWGKVQ
jgi:type II secretory pathway pseudopilin PulG